MRACARPVFKITDLITHTYNLLYSFSIFPFSVCGSSQCSATFGFHLVRGSSRLPSDEHGPAVLGGVPDRAALPLLFTGLHHLSMVGIFTKVTKTIHQVYMHLIFILHISM